jgi:hypothetical protein
MRILLWPSIPGSTVSDLGRPENDLINASFSMMFQFVVSSAEQLAQHR